MQKVENSSVKSDSLTFFRMLACSKRASSMAVVSSEYVCAENGRGLLGGQLSRATRTY